MNIRLTKQDLKSIIEKNRDKKFLINSFTDKSYTYSEFNELVLKMCSLIESNFHLNKERVCVVTDNDFDTVVLYFALLYVGATTVPINSKSKIDDINYIVSTSDSKYIFCKKKLDDLETFDYCNYTNLPPLPKEPFYDFNDDNISIIMHSSGTTGKPKGIMHKLSSLYNNAMCFSNMVGIDSSNRFLNYLSLTYFGGYYNLLLLPFFSGSSVVFSKQFDVSMVGSLSKVIEKYDVNTLWLVPSIMSIMNRFDRSDKDSLEIYRKKIKLSLVGTAPLSMKTRKSFEDKYGIFPLENYGLSETFFISTNTIDTLTKICSVGKVLDGVEVELGGDGEMIVKSEFLMGGYLLESEDSRNMLENNRFKTGDIGYIKDGMLYLTDRKKDLIIRGGENISPKEIESLLLEIDGIDEVAVVGIEHEIYGEDIIAFIVGGQGAVEMQKKAKEVCAKKLDTKKIPSQIISMESLHKNDSGKIDKKKLKEAYTTNI